jgi:glutamyl/glutaminyl-tRNA synthetase
MVSPALEYKEQGYLPEAMLNFMSLLGWNPGTPQEIFTLEELVKAFSLERMQKQGAIFNPDKLNWINKEHIKMMAPEEIKKNILEWLPAEMRNPKIIPVVFERIAKWGDIKEMVKVGELDFFFKQPEFPKEKLLYKNTSLEQIAKNLKLAIKSLQEIDENNFTQEAIKNALMQIADTLDSRGELLHPVRFALSGKDKSPDPFTIAAFLGKNETLSRLQKAI